MSNLAYRDTIFSLNGRVAAVTGAAGHLGKCMASILARAGATVILVGRNEHRLNVLRDSLDGEGLKAVVAATDLTEAGSSSAIATRVEALGGRLDVLVNNAYSATPGAIDTATDLDYADAYSQTVVASARLVRELSPYLEAETRSRGASSVINIASMYGIVSPDPTLYAPGEQNPPQYGPAKAALLQWTRYAAVHLAPNIRVNAISPGPFPSPDVQHAKPDFVSKLAGKTAAGRIGSPHEVEGATLFLASPASAYVTGANIVVDGGWTVL